MSTLKKERILKAATKLFALKGYKDASMAELAKMTGVAQGTIFYHYHNKESLFLDILKDIESKIVAEFSRYLAEKKFKTGLDLMEDVVGFYLLLAGSMEDQFMLLHRHDAYELARGNSECREYLESIYNCLVNIFEKAIVAGQADHSVADLPARKTALIIFTMVDGLVRFNSYDLYNAAALYGDLITSIRRLLMNHQPAG